MKTNLKMSRYWWRKISQILPTKYIIEKNDGFLQLYKYMNIKIWNEIIVAKCIWVIKVVKIIFKFYIQILMQNINYSV